MADNQRDPLWHPEVIKDYLAGGTGLALQSGHRRSVDLDFFSEQVFDEESLVQKLGGLHDLSIVSKARSTLHTAIGYVKVSFLGYTLFQRKFSRANYSRVHILKSLTYFEDAEKDPMPDMLVDLSWNGSEDILQD